MESTEADYQLFELARIVMLAAIAEKHSMLKALQSSAEADDKGLTSLEAELASLEGERDALRFGETQQLEAAIRRRARDPDRAEFVLETIRKLRV